jgi:hypothetical protein
MVSNPLPKSEYYADKLLFSHVVTVKCVKCGTSVVRRRLAAKLMDAKLKYSTGLMPSYPTNVESSTFTVHGLSSNELQIRFSDVLVGSTSFFSFSKHAAENISEYARV